QEFLAKADKEYLRYGWPTDHMINRYVVCYLNIFSKSPHRKTSPYGVAKLEAAINKKRPLPCSEDEMKVILSHLQTILTTQGRRFPPPQSADAEVMKSLRGVDIIISTRVIRQAINWAMAADYLSTQGVLRLVDPDARQASSDEVPIETSFTRTPGRPTGD